jgi:hypothetical protein
MLWLPSFKTRIIKLSYVTAIRYSCDLSPFSPCGRRVGDEEEQAIKAEAIGKHQRVEASRVDSRSVISHATIGVSTSMRADGLLAE